CCCGLSCRSLGSKRISGSIRIHRLSCWSRWKVWINSRSLWAFWCCGNNKFVYFAVRSSLSSGRCAWSSWFYMYWFTVGSRNGSWGSECTRRDNEFGWFPIGTCHSSWSGTWSCGYDLYWFPIWAWNWCCCGLSCRSLGSKRISGSIRIHRLSCWSRWKVWINSRSLWAFWCCGNNKFVYIAVRSSLSSGRCAWSSWFYMYWFTVGSRNGSWGSECTLRDNEFGWFPIGTCHCSWSGTWSCGYDLYWFPIWAWNWCCCGLSLGSKRISGSIRIHRLSCWSRWKVWINSRSLWAFWCGGNNKFVYFAVRSSLSSGRCAWSSWFYMYWFTVGSRNGSRGSECTRRDNEFGWFPIGTCHCSWSGTWSCGYDLYWFPIWAWNWCCCGLSCRSLGSKRISGSIRIHRLSCWSRWKVWIISRSLWAFWCGGNNKFVYFAVRSSLSSGRCAWSSWFYMYWFTVGSRNGSRGSECTRRDNEFGWFPIG
ncbi:unnamed protein product, partial [Larinioides sclopetarius]